MALDKFGFGTVGHSGVLGGISRKLHFYATNDGFAAVETNGYFDAVANQFNEGKGDVIIVSYANGGTNGVRIYSVNRTAGDIALTLQIATAAA